MPENKPVFKPRPRHEYMPDPWQCLECGEGPDAPAHTGDALLAEMKSWVDLRKGWDDDGAVPISKGALDTALELITKWLEVRADHPHIPAPFVAPCGDGSIFVEWEKRERRLEVFIDENGIDVIKVEGLKHTELFALDNDEVLALVVT